MNLPSNKEFHVDCPFEEKELKSLIRKYGTAFVSDILKDDLSALRNRLADMAKHRYHLQEFPKSKEEIVKAKKEYDELMEPFRSQLRANTAKTKVINQILKRREEDAGIE